MGGLTLRLLDAAEINLVLTDVVMEGMDELQHSDQRDPGGIARRARTPQGPRGAVGLKSN